MEAITKAPRAKRESSIPPPEPPQRAPARSRGAPHTPSVAGSGRSEPWKRSPKSPARSAKASPPQSFLSERRTDPAERPIRPAERDRAAASLGGDHQSPSRKARKLHPPPEPPQRAQARSRGAPTSDSGTGPKPASKAINSTNRRHPCSSRVPVNLNRKSIASVSRRYRRTGQRVDLNKNGLMRLTQPLYHGLCAAPSWRKTHGSTAAPGINNVSAIHED